MTAESIQLVVTEAGKFAKQRADDSCLRAQNGGSGETLSSESAQWMQVKMLAEIALQLRVMNDGQGAKQPEELGG